MEKKTAKINASQEQKRYAIINGLLPNIRKQVLMHDITTIDDIRRWASIAESTAADDDNPIEVATALKDLQLQIRNLFTVQPSDLEPDPIQRPRSPSIGRRVRFQDEVQPDYPLNTFNQSNQWTQPQCSTQSNWSTQSQPMQQTYQPQQQQQYQQSRQPYFNENNYQQPQQDQQQPQRFNNNNRNYMPQQSNGRNNTENYSVQYPNYRPQQQFNPNRSSCGWCGGPRHNRAVCRASQVICNQCGRVGHFSKVCRSGRRPQ